MNFFWFTLLGSNLTLQPNFYFYSNKFLFYSLLYDVRKAKAKNNFLLPKYSKLNFNHLKISLILKKTFFNLKLTNLSFLNKSMTLQSQSKLTLLLLNLWFSLTPILIFSDYKFHFELSAFNWIVFKSNYFIWKFFSHNIFFKKAASIEQLMWFIKLIQQKISFVFLL